MAADVTGDGEDAIVAEINITPLTDVFLVLLIIFMVTSSVIANTGKNVDLPEAQQASETEPQAVNVTIDKDGGVEVNGNTVARDQLRVAIEAALAETEDKTVILRGDRLIDYGDAVFVLDEAQLAGAKGFALATTRKRGE